MFSIIMGANMHSMHYILANRFQNRRSYHADFVNNVPFYFLDIIGPFSINFSFNKIALRNKSGDQEIVVAIKYHQRMKLNDQVMSWFHWPLPHLAGTKSSACLTLEFAAINILRPYFVFFLSCDCNSQPVIILKKVQANNSSFDMSHQTVEKSDASYF